MRLGGAQLGQIDPLDGTLPDRSIHLIEFRRSSILTTYIRDPGTTKVVLRLRTH